MKEPTLHQKTARLELSKKDNDVKERKKTSVQTANVDGKVFTTTAAFDTFWRYTAERHAVEEKRRSGEPQPWTEDPILQSHKFCSVFRVADRGCQFLIREKPEDIVFRVLLYDMFTRIETYQLLEKQLGPLTWASYRRKKYVAVLQDAMDSDVRVYTGAFQKPAPTLGHRTAFLNHLSLMELTECAYMADAFDTLFRYPGLGDFMAFQLLLNLSYTPLLRFGEDDFVVAGIGAQKGLKKCFAPAASVAGSEPALRHFARLGLAPARLGKEGRPMTLVDVEHTLCEVHKYTRLGGTALPSSWKQKNQVKQYAVTTKCMPRYPVLPRAWADPVRSCTRPRPGRYERPEKHYVVGGIVDRQEDADGEVWYFVDWLGYDASARTWEPEGQLREDAAPLVEEFEEGRAKRAGGVSKKRTESVRKRRK
ncbi:hypothetical protein DFH11DRAFT_1686403 [Phellopilus nigrolimitatus]|nr:hypothetical protein DFH11DRAFT_1686403 [Phellopilus nigrolimitatus]